MIGDSGSWRSLDPAELHAAAERRRRAVARFWIAAARAELDRARFRADGAGGGARLVAASSGRAVRPGGGVG